MTTATCPHCGAKLTYVPMKAQVANTLNEMAVASGVKPCNKLEDLVGDFWPEDESIDDFIKWVDKERGRKEEV